MNVNSVLIGTEDPKPLVAYYTKLFGEPAGSEGGYTWWQIGTGGVTVGAHSEVKGKNAHPGRVIWNIESADVKGDFERLKAAGATVVREPYNPGPAEAPEMSIATFADPDDNYFPACQPDVRGQLVSPIQRARQSSTASRKVEVRSRNTVEVGADLRTIWDSPDRAQARRAFEAFTTKDLH